MKKTIIYIGLILVAVIGLSTIITRCDTRHAEPKIQTDTLIIHDTIYQPKLDSIEVVKWYPYEVVKTDTIKQDSIIIDTLKVPIPISEYRFDTTIAETQIQGVLTGFNVEMEELTATNYRTSTTIVEKPKKRRWGVGIQCGYGISTHDNQIYASPTIGIGLSWNFINF